LIFGLFLSLEANLSPFVASSFSSSFPDKTVWVIALHSLDLKTPVLFLAFPFHQQKKGLSSTLLFYSPSSFTPFALEFNLSLHLPALFGD